jgi:hypothetical protein
MPDSRTRSFVTTFLLWALLPVTIIGIGNLLVDPLGLLPARGIEGVNAHKPLLRDRERLFKPYAVTRLKPQVVIIGTSRSNHALDPAHPAFGGATAYNLSISGTNIREARTMFEHAAATGALRSAIFELDMGMFDADAAVELDYLDSPGHPRRYARLATLLATALSWNTLRLTIGTLRGQHDPDEYTASGRQTEHVFRSRIASYGGLRNTFEGYMRRLAPAEQRQAAAWRAARVDARHFPGMDELARILGTARARHIALTLYVSPIHALDQQAVEAIYGAALMEEWRRALLATIATVGGEVSLWDFSGYNAVTTEPLPAVGSSDAGPGAMHYYWDQSHYRVQVGDWVLERTSGAPPRGAPAPEDFGAPLTSASIEARLASNRAAAVGYAREHPSEAAFVRQLIGAGSVTP